MLVSEKERRTKNPSSRHGVAEEIVSGDKVRLNEEWESLEYSTPGMDIDWQNSTGKTDMVRACVNHGQWTAASKSRRLSKCHMCRITSSSLHHVLKMFSSSMNASGRRWHHLPTASSLTAWFIVAHSLLMCHFSLLTYDFKMKTK